MLTKRTLIVLAAAAIVAACTNVTELSRTNTQTGPLKLNNVNVDASGLKLVTEGRQINKTTEQLENDLAAAVRLEAEEFSDPNGLPADVNVTIDKVYLAPLIDRVVAGTSYIESTISVTDAADNSVIVSPSSVKGTSETLRGVGTLGAVGALANASVETDYQNAINGYANALIASLKASR